MACPAALSGGRLSPIDASVSGPPHTQQPPLHRSTHTRQTQRSTTMYPDSRESFNKLGAVRGEVACVYLERRRMRSRCNRGTFATPGGDKLAPTVMPRRVGGVGDTMDGMRIPLASSIAYQAAQCRRGECGPEPPWRAAWLAVWARSPARCRGASTLARGLGSARMRTSPSTAARSCGVVASAESTRMLKMAGEPWPSDRYPDNDEMPCIVPVLACDTPLSAV